MRYCIVGKADIPKHDDRGVARDHRLHGPLRFHSRHNRLKDEAPPVPDRSILVMLEAIHLESEEC
jgi:hypothetical protein